MGDGPRPTRRYYWRVWRAAMAGSIVLRGRAEPTIAYEPKP